MKRSSIKKAYYQFNPWIRDSNMSSTNGGQVAIAMMHYYNNQRFQIFFCVSGKRATDPDLLQELQK